MIAQLLVVAALACPLALVSPAAFAQPPKPPRRPAPPPRPAATPVGWWRDAVFYTIDVRSFADRATGPGTGDGIGDFTGLLEHLDYLNDGNPETDSDLGVTALRLLTPLSTSHPDGTGLLDFYSTHGDFGSTEDLRAFIEECHLRGVRVALDFPVDATSGKHPWFVEAAKDPKSPMRAWYRWSETGPGDTAPGTPSPWHPVPGGFYFAPAGTGFPALNHANAELSGVVAEVLRFWAKDAAVDGFFIGGARRLAEASAATTDSPRTHAALAALRGPMIGAKPAAALFADGLDATTTAATYLNDQLDAAATDDVPAAILASLTTGDSAPLMSTLETAAKVAPARGAFAHALSGPGRPRVATSLRGDAARLRTAATLSLTLPGLPMIFAGDELGLTGDAAARTPMPWTAGPAAGFTVGTPWTAIAENASTIHAEAAAKDPGSLLNHYKKLIRLRAGTPALRSGSYLPIVGDHACLVAYLRQEGASTALVVANLGDAPLSEYALSFEASSLRGDYTLVDAISGEKGLAPVFTATGGLSDYRPIGALAPRTAYVFVLSPD